MSEMVERVAKAIFGVDRIPNHTPAWADMTPEFREMYTGFSRAAIEAMRAPTEIMLIKAGRDHCGDDHYDPLTAWEIMIDEAMK